MADDNYPETDDIAMPENEKSTISYWLKWIPAAKKAAKRHWGDTKAGYEEYENDIKSTGSTRDDERERPVFPVYFSSCKHLEAAYYAKAPKPRAKRRFDIEDETALTAAFILERLGTYHIESIDFDEIIEAAVGDKIHSDKASLQVSYEANTEPVQELLQLGHNGEEEVYVDGNDQIYEGEVLINDEGHYFYEKVSPLDGTVKLAPVAYNEVLHTPTAKHQSEIREIAYKFCLSYEEACARFCTSEDGTIDHDKAASLPWEEVKKPTADDERSGRVDEGQVPGKYLSGWEIYCKDTKHCYWVSETRVEDFLDTKEDPYELRQFFPSTPFIISNKPHASLYPTPVYIHLAPTIKELHKLYGRIFGLVDAARRRALVDGSSPEVMKAFTDLGENEFIIVDSLTKLLEQSGGVGGLVQYLPVAELTQAIGELVQVVGFFKDQFNEIMGIPDIIRGVSDPIEAVGTAQIATQAAHDRFKKDKKAVQRLCRDGLELMLDLSLKVWTDEKIARVVGLKYSQPEHQERFAPALALLRDDQERFVRIDIETDSTTFMDEQREIQRRSLVSQTLIQGLATIGGMQNQEFAETALRSLLASISGMGGSEEYEDSVKGAVNELMEKRKNQPPAPDPKMIELQMKQQSEAQKAQTDQLEVQLKAQKDQMEAALEARDLSRKEQELAVKAQNDGAELQLKFAEHQLDKVIAQFEVALATKSQEIDEFKARVLATEKMMEERRLASDREMNTLKMIIDTQANVAPPEPMFIPPAEPVPVVVNIDNGKKGRKVVRTAYDEAGNSQSIIEEIE